MTARSADAKSTPIAVIGLKKSLLKYPTIDGVALGALSSGVVYSAVADAAVADAAE